MAKNAIRDPKALEKYRDKQDKAKKAKGQLMSEWIFGVFNFPKKPTKKFDEFLPQNLEIGSIKPLFFLGKIFVQFLR